MRNLSIIIASLIIPLAPLQQAAAAIDISRASVERLDNGLTLIILEDRSHPVVSVQTVYKTGARDDPAGRLGLAHFFEHMAFRGSKNFPDTGLVSEIYAAGGEWHGYTWIDLTTYFSTAPRETLDLLLDIETDRMARLELRKEDVEAESGAVISELNGYRNDVSTVLFDVLLETAFLVHPYRNNTIGYEGDVKAITHDDIVDFYARHYAPQNAVIAIVGDIDRDAVRRAVAKRIGKIRKPKSATAPVSAEPSQTGERRVNLLGGDGEKLVKIAYPAPAAASVDFAAYLVLQDIVAAGAGVSFLQNDWGAPARNDSPLGKLDGDLSTWLIPTAEPYVFVISGAVDLKTDEVKTEDGIQKAFDGVAARAPDEDAVIHAKQRVREALTFDIETTEDAAHQLAYFAGIDALDALLELEDAVDAVTSADLQRIAATYLRADLRTIAWARPGDAPRPAVGALKAGVSDRTGAAAPPVEPASPDLIGGAGDFEIALNPTAASPTIAASAVIPGLHQCLSCAPHSPAPGFTTISAAALSADKDGVIDRLRRDIASVSPMATSSTQSNDPLTRLEEIFASYLTTTPTDGASRFLITASGDFGASNYARQIQHQLADIAAPSAVEIHVGETNNDINIVIDEAKAQAALGYAVKAPGAGDPDYLAWRIALYILSHGYEGRLGKETISRRGLVYYIDAAYRAAANDGLITVAAGVDQDKLGAMQDAMKSELARLLSSPPTEQEIADAKRHLIGRKISAAQSNSEIIAEMALDWAQTGGLRNVSDLEAALAAVTREDVLKILPAFTHGAVITIDVASDQNNGRDF